MIFAPDPADTFPAIHFNCPHEGMRHCPGVYSLLHLLSLLKLKSAPRHMTTGVAGSVNIMVGHSAGSNVTTGSCNIFIGPNDPTVVI